MQTNIKKKYDDLLLDSSNLLIQADSVWVLGNYPLAAYRFLEAGRMRCKMGQLSFDDSQFADAAEDWLSATACFLRGTSMEQAQKRLDFVRRLQRDNKIPDDRKDIFAALRDRERELANLEKMIDNFLAEYGERGDSLDSAKEETLKFLLSQVRELPGLPMLHYAISSQARNLGRDELAARHAEWGAKFGTVNADYSHTESESS